MLALLLLPLLCPDTVYFNELFSPRIIRQGDTTTITNWNVASAAWWDLETGRIEKGQDSFDIYIRGPFPRLPSGSRLTIDIGTYTTGFKKLSGKGCITTIVERKTVSIKRIKKLEPKIFLRKNIDLNGRTL